MRFLADQDVYAVTVRFLRCLAHDVATASDLGLSRAVDEKLLQTAQEQDRIVVTRDRDYGGLVFVHGCGTGVIYLRMLPSTEDLVHAELERVLTLHTESELRKSFIVVEPGRHRIRRIDPAEDADNGDA